ncbi:Mce family protein [Gordonia polyisoprenivorans NBRC 16320 = JCM 10675]|uniref:MCE family protein n=1 Tax=Gordonia polyisoprenivorans TaxID=84595 RepID=A0A846WS92_9ACTN|nr:MCE family protein [Gordonia polyisoprenivorans]OZC29442.1 MCE family protein [Gordonia polyisoprenivorans]GAB25426.1 Mce family protein [Gordonia polyisoprenivorans NBRC 16320 = JCM 10675]
MRSRLVQVQLAVFAIVAICAVGYTGYAYGGFQRYTGIGTYTVTADLADAGGLYPNALVTYRGVDVGVVTGLDAGVNGATARLQIKSDNHIPANSQAYVRSVSAAGEQFIDLVPTNASGPNLADGSRIQQSNTNIPIPATQVIEKVYGLLQAVPKDSLRTVVDESSVALNDVGPDLNKALVAASQLVGQAQRNLGATTSLITDANPVLSQLDDTGPQISAIATNLDTFTRQLALSDNTIQTTLRTGAPFFDTFSGTLRDLTPSLPILLANLQSTGEVLRVNVPGLRHILVVYPAVATAVNAMERGMQSPGDLLSGQGNLDVKLFNSSNPPSCTQGYQDTQRRDPSDLSPVNPSATEYCTLPKDDPRVVRGIRNAPCATDPSVRTADLAQCPDGLPSTWPQMLARLTGAAPVAGGSPTPGERPTSGSTIAVPYDPQTGRFRTPDGTTLQIGNLIMAPNDKGVITQWQQLFPR